MGCLFSRSAAHEEERDGSSSAAKTAYSWYTHRMNWDVERNSVLTDDYFSNPRPGTTGKKLTQVSTLWLISKAVAVDGCRVKLTANSLLSEIARRADIYSTHACL